MEALIFYIAYTLKNQKNFKIFHERLLVLLSDAETFRKY